ncbi:hypothetical protein BRPE64_ACDS03480 [Caballeronia insecticola]|uniref:Uncharacterized protein n=1 Tax=Caballeronia insecticola TaxID=758793 RepID=R4WW06_9BURK|nr:hypothetical protein BRPE64_ACDS03480 [Caballeronia insecticola]
MARPRENGGVILYERSPFHRRFNDLHAIALKFSTRFALK